MNWRIQTKQTYWLKRMLEESMVEVFGLMCGWICVSVHLCTCAWSHLRSFEVIYCSFNKTGFPLGKLWSLFTTKNVFPYFFLPHKRTHMDTVQNKLSERFKVLHIFTTHSLTSWILLATLSTAPVQYLVQRHLNSTVKVTSNPPHFCPWGASTMLNFNPLLVGWNVTLTNIFLLHREYNWNPVLRREIYYFLTHKAWYYKMQLASVSSSNMYLLQYVFQDQNQDHRNTHPRTNASPCKWIPGGSVWGERKTTTWKIPSLIILSCDQLKLQSMK